MSESPPLEELRNCALSYAKETFEDSGEIRACCFLHSTLTPEGKAENCIVVVYPESFNSEGDKDFFAHMVRVTAEKTKAVAATFVTEAWMADGKSELAPADRPDRIEVVTITLETPETREFIVMKIDRSEEKPKLLEPDEPWMNIEGRMTRFLPQHSLDKN
jgi:hypothetical protein